tara:strand:- start:24479 stop:25399 length:921 start_codon:yes stop_codon:yes gene_type:complete
MKFGLTGLGLKSGDSILIPDFICDVVLHPLKQLNIDPIFYELNDNLIPCWSDMKNLLNHNTKAILMVHYFGQPQDIIRYQTFCKENNLYLIEDNAHGYGGKYNGKKLGTFGDFGFSSPRKQINLISGGLLHINKKMNILPERMPKHSFDIRKYLKNKIMDYLPNQINIIKKIITDRPKYEEKRLFREKEINDLLIDNLSKQKYEKTNWDIIRKKRHDAHKYWEKLANKKGLESVYKIIDDECIPWCYAAYAENHSQAIKWFKWGWEKGYNIFSWPSLPEEILKKNGKAIKRWERLVCFSTKSKPLY